MKRYHFMGTDLLKSQYAYNNDTVGHAIISRKSRRIHTYAFGVPLVSKLGNIFTNTRRVFVLHFDL